MPEKASKGVRLVVGASRGIGLALVEAQLANPTVQRVIATHRRTSDRHGLDALTLRYGERLQRRVLDITNPHELAEFSEYLAQQPCGIDLAVNAAGILHEPDLWPEKALTDCAPETLLRMFQVNSIGPLLVARAILSAQRPRQRFTFAALSAMVGSIGDNRLGGWYGYRASKAALNQFLRTLSIECRRKYPAATILALHPGTTDTGLSKPFQRNVPAGRLRSPTESANRILRVLEGADPDMSGTFRNWDGSEIPW